MPKESQSNNIAFLILRGRYSQTSEIFAKSGQFEPELCGRICGREEFMKSKSLMLQRFAAI